MQMKWFRGAKSSQEDKALFWASEELLKEEELGEFLSHLREERFFCGDERAKVLEYLGFFENSRSFLDRRVQEARVSLVNALRELKIATAVHFLVFPRNQTGGRRLRHSLHPDYFILGEEDLFSLDQHRFYLGAEEQTRRAVSRVEEAYGAFRAIALKRIGAAASD